MPSNKPKPGHSFADKYPHLTLFWVENLDRPQCGPFEVGPRSGDKVRWRCSKCGDLYNRTISNQSRNDLGLCRICAYKHSGEKCHERALRENGNLATTNPTIASEWDYDKNSPFTPDKVTPHSPNIYWWKCPLSIHESYPASVYDRTRDDLRRVGCPVCGLTKRAQLHNKTLIEKVGSFKSINPKGQMKYWDYKENSKLQRPAHPNGIFPEDVTPSSNELVYWKCENGHHWPNIIKSQVDAPGCAICRRTRKFSDSEKAVLYYVNQMFPGQTEGNYHPKWKKKVRSRHLHQMLQHSRTVRWQIVPH